MSTVADRRPRRRIPSRLSGDDLPSVVRSAAAGDEHSWDVLLREFGGMIWAVARAHRLSDADAADVAQATWLRVVQHIDAVRDPARLGAWIATTARRECLRVLRDAQRHVLVGEEMPEPAGDDPLPEAEVMLDERDAALWRSFSCLRASDQALLRMLMTDPRPSYEEVAAALDMPIGSIGPTRARALERLRRHLNDNDALSLLSA